MRIFDLSLGEMLWSRRSIFLGLLVGGPVLLAFALRSVVALLPDTAPRVNGAVVGGGALFGMMIWLLYIRFIIPVLGVFYGTALIADEVDDKTITYLFTRPIPRRAVLFGKYLAYLACTVLLILPSVVLVYLLVAPIGGNLGESFPALVADLGMLAVGLCAYGAVFAYVGARLKRPLVIGLVFAFGWEPAVLLFPGYLKRLTVAYYVQALVPHAMPQDSAVNILMQVFREVPTVAVSLISLAVIVGLSLWAAGRAVETREYVLEQ
jgi:ABC-type Na+ efflux pump permease subunit